VLGPALGTVGTGLFGQSWWVIAPTATGGAALLGTLIFTLSSLRWSPRSIAIASNSVEAATWFVVAALTHMYLTPPVRDGVNASNAAVAAAPPHAAVLVVTCMYFIAAMFTFSGVKTFLPLVMTESSPLAVRANVVGIGLMLTYTSRSTATLIEGWLVCRIKHRAVYMCAAASAILVVREHSSFFCNGPQRCQHYMCCSSHKHVHAHERSKIMSPESPHTHPSCAQLIMVLLLPDTQRLALERASQVWRRHWLWRRLYKTRQQQQQLLPPPPRQNRKVPW
jgi:hypothetical protein